MGFERNHREIWSFLVAELPNGAHRGPGDRAAAVVAFLITLCRLPVAGEGLLGGTGSIRRSIQRPSAVLRWLKWPWRQGVEAPLVAEVAASLSGGALRAAARNVCH